jgi:hypothetical protein
MQVFTNGIEYKLGLASQALHPLAYWKVFMPPHHDIDRFPAIPPTVCALPTTQLDAEGDSQRTCYSCQQLVHPIWALMHLEFSTLFGYFTIVGREIGLKLPNGAN